MPDETEQTGRHWYVYLIYSMKTGKLYTGISTDPRARLKQHNAGTGAKSTRGQGPWILVHTETVRSKSVALKRELAIKKLSHEAKLMLARNSRLCTGFVTPLGGEAGRALPWPTPTGAPG
jgi:putative endonuclease